MGDLGRVRTVLSETSSKNAKLEMLQNTEDNTTGHAALSMCKVLREMAATVPPLFSFISKCNRIVCACTVAAIHSQTHMQ